MENVDVLIVGGGGCGLTLSIFLADLGVDFLTVERHPGTSILPKAHYLNPRTMEILRQHAADAEIFAQGTPPYHRSRTKWYTSFGGNGPLDRKTIFETGSLGGHGSEREGAYREASPADSANLPQLRLEPIFRQHAERRAPGRIRFSHELLDFTQDGEGVTAVLRDRAQGETYEVRARYMIAADGGKTVGPKLGIEQSGPKRLITQISAHIEADLSACYPDDRVLLNWIRNPSTPGVTVIVAMGPGKWGRHSPEWSIGFMRRPGHPEKFDEDNVVPYLREALGLPDLAMKVRCVTEWNVEGVLADKYREGRVFLAGDAAHRHPPTTGLGLNTGIQDAHNLAWKLALVCHGKAQPRLLDSYEAERRPVGGFNVNWALNAFFNHILLEAAIVQTHPANLDEMARPSHAEAAFATLFADTPVGATRRARLKRIYATQHIEFYAHDVELGFVYDRGALLGDGTAAPPRDPMGALYRPSTRPGHRLPHCWIDDGERRLSTHDLSGCSKAFVLITDEHGAGWEAAARDLAKAYGVDLALARIAQDGPYRDTEGRWAELKEVEPGGAMLVRPDNIVAWRSLRPARDAHEELARGMRAVLD